MKPSLTALILAAGRSKRMHSDTPKCLFPLAGKPVIWHVLTSIWESNLFSKIVLVVSSETASEVSSACRNLPIPISTVVQEKPLGTGHAVFVALQSKEFVGSSPFFVVGGDTPLLLPQTIRALWNHHCKGKGALSLLTTTRVAPNPYGKILRTKKGTFSRIEEALSYYKKKSTPSPVEEINAGAYFMEPKVIRSSLDQLANAYQQKKSKTQEMYLTDLPQMLTKRGKKICIVETSEPTEGLGINTRAELAVAEKVLRERAINHLLTQDVTVVDPSHTYVDVGVDVGKDTILYPNVCLFGNSKVGTHCILEPNVILKGTTIGDHCHIKAHSVLDSAKLQSNVTVGPFAHLRPGTELEQETKVGNFVEIKQSHIGEGTKINHLTYIGDADIGEQVNVGAGVITCNYDGVTKHRTLVEDGAFIGSDCQLVAPVRIGKGAYIGSGSTITKDVPSGSLAIARSRQITKENYLKKKPRKLTTEGNK